MVADAAKMLLWCDAGDWYASVDKILGRLTMNKAYTWLEQNIQGRIRVDFIDC